MGLMVALLVLNFLISTWNSWVVGQVWDMCTGAFEKVLLWSALVQSVVGYSSVAIVGIILGGYQAGWWTDEKFMSQMFSLWYLLVIIPVISTGFILWLHSVISFLRRPSLGGGMVGAWNSYAQFRNMAGALEHIPSASKAVGELFGSLFSSKGKKDGKAVIALLVVAVSLLFGIVMTATVFSISRRSVRRQIAAA